MPLAPQKPGDPSNCPLLSQLFMVPSAAVHGRIMTGAPQTELVPMLVGQSCPQSNQCAWWMEDECAARKIARALSKGDQP